MSNLVQSFEAANALMDFDNNGTAFVAEGNSEREVVVLLHGVGLSHAMWFEQAKVLSKYYRVIRYDMLGHGGSARTDSELDLSAFAEQLKNLLDYLNIDRCHLIGFSLGALVAQAFAVSSSYRLDKLVLMNSVYARNEEQRLAIYERALKVATKGNKDSAEAAITRWFSEEYRNKNSDLIQLILTQLLGNNHLDYLRAYCVFAMSDASLADKLDLIKTETLVITGALDVGSTPEMSKRMHDALPNSILIVVEGQRHMLPIEAPDITNQHLLDFFEGS